MEKLVSICPYCNGAMEVERLRCTACRTAVEGHIRLPRLARLPAEQREFAELFIRSSGSLKAVAQKLGISYPTVRNRLDALIATLEADENQARDARTKVLDALEAGEISVKEAVELLKEQ